MYSLVRNILFSSYNILKSNNIHRHYSEKSNTHIMRYLKSYGVSKEQMLLHPDIFQLSKQELLDKIQYLSTKVDNKDNILLLCLLPFKDIIKYFDIKKNHINKISELSAFLKVPEEQGCHLFLKYPFLLRSKVSTITEKIDIMLSGGISLGDCLKDLWPLTYTKDHLKGRIMKIGDLKLKPIKPWMLHCTEDVLLRTGVVREENRAALVPYLNATDYLCNRLNMSEYEFKVFSAKHPPVTKVQVAKMKEVIDFLLSEGFTEYQIKQTPRILCHSIQTIKNRLQIFKEKNYKPYTLLTLCKNKKDFEEFIIKL